MKCKCGSTYFYGYESEDNDCFPIVSKISNKKEGVIGPYICAKCGNMFDRLDKIAMTSLEKYDDLEVGDDFFYQGVIWEIVRVVKKEKVYDGFEVEVLVKMKSKKDTEKIYAGIVYYARDESFIRGEVLNYEL